MGGCIDFAHERWRACRSNIQAGALAKFLSKTGAVIHVYFEPHACAAAHTSGLGKRGLEMVRIRSVRILPK